MRKFLVFMAIIAAAQSSFGQTPARPPILTVNTDRLSLDVIHRELGPQINAAQRVNLAASKLSPGNHALLKSTAAGPNFRVEDLGSLDMSDKALQDFFVNSAAWMRQVNMFLAKPGARVAEDIESPKPKNGDICMMAICVQDQGLLKVVGKTSMSSAAESTSSKSEQEERERQWKEKDKKDQERAKGLISTKQINEYLQEKRRLERELCVATGDCK